MIEARDIRHAWIGGKLLLLFVSLFLSSCYLPDPRCSSHVDLIDAPRDAAYWIDRACMTYQNRTGADPYRVVAALAGSEIRYTVDLPPCTPRRDHEPTPKACATLYPDRPAVAHIQRGEGVNHRTAHEVYHILLWEIDRETHPEDHHKEMRDLRLCHPLSACGYQDPWRNDAIF